jgi:hypothetical protein
MTEPIRPIARSDDGVERVPAVRILTPEERDEQRRERERRRTRRADAAPREAAPRPAGDDDAPRVDRRA